jgi:methyltransferase (TIGR00027 family)
VILGAGLDTFAYRSPHATAGLKVFEVDHPATQEWKRRQLQAARIPIPQELTFTPLDFERQSLADGLRADGFRPDQPSFFSWLGVTMYLTRETMLATMNQISSTTPAGSLVVFDYMTPPASRNVLHRLVFRLLAARLARGGEPWRGFHTPQSLGADLKTAGFAQTEDMGPEDINARFFKGRKDHLRVGPSAHVMTARRRRIRH